MLGFFKHVLKYQGQLWRFDTFRYLHNHKSAMLFMKVLMAWQLHAYIGTRPNKKPGDPKRDGTPEQPIPDSPPTKKD